MVARMRTACSSHGAKRTLSDDDESPEGTAACTSVSTVVSCTLRFTCEAYGSLIVLTCQRSTPHDEPQVEPCPPVGSGIGVGPPVGVAVGLGVGVGAGVGVVVGLGVGVGTGVAVGFGVGVGVAPPVRLTSST